MRRVLALARVAAVIALAGLAGCTADAAVQPQDNTPQSELADAEQLLVDKAREQLVKECMAKAGFRYWAGPIAELEELKAGGYVLDDVAWARKHGYGTRLYDKLAAVQRP